MSGLREGLGEWARSHGDHVAADLAQGAAEATTRGRVTRRRRVRVGGIASGIVVAVGVVAFAIPMLGGASAIAPGAVNTGDAQVRLVEEEVPTRLQCDLPWTLQQGETLHMDVAAGEVSGEWSVIEDGGAIHARPDSLWAGYETLEWHQHSTDAGPMGAMMITTVVAVQNGTIVGVAPVTGAGVSNGVSEFGMSAGLPGVCGIDEASAPDGTYDFHVVTQLVDRRGLPLATWVDPAGPNSVAIRDLEGLLGPSDVEPTVVPAKLREPEGDTYQAFVVAPPTAPSCTPLPDQLAAGQPGVDNLQYEVTIPGVQPITGDVWGNAPAVVIDDPEYEAWYVGVPSAIIADQVDGGNPTATVDWTTGTTWGETEPPGSLRLINFDGASGIFIDTLPVANCVFTQPIPAIDGAVFLVIAGVDVAAVEAANPGADWAVDPSTMYTWVYLGQAG